MERLSKAADASGKPLEYRIVTNGTLLDDGLIELFVARQVQMQITIDGKKETHNSRRFWKETMKGSFDQLDRNIKKIVSIGGANLIQLRMNVDSDNINEVSDVAAYATANGIKDFKRGNIHFWNKQSAYDNKLLRADSRSNSAEIKLFRNLKSQNFSDTPVDLEPKTTCLYQWQHGYTVTPNLDFYKCDELIDYPEKAIGKLDEQGNLLLHKDNYDDAVNRKPTDFENCETCRYLPQCGSGCSVRALNTKGSLNKNFCEASYDSVRKKVELYCMSVQT